MNALSIKFLSLPSAKNIIQDHGSRCTKVGIEGFPGVTQETVITGVYVDGSPCWTAPLFETPLTVCIRPQLEQQGQRIEVRCVTPSVGAHRPVSKASSAINRTLPARPSLKPSYGLTAPETKRWNASAE
jgi:hypothetical protein